MDVVSRAVSSSLPIAEFPKRPKGLLKQVEVSFTDVSKGSPPTSDWGIYNGGKRYGICGVSEENLLEGMIKNSSLGDRDIYFLDVGAGNFQLIDDLASKTNELLKRLNRRDMHIHYIGVRGEGFIGKSIVLDKYFTIYKFGNFKIEHISDQFKALGLNLTNKINIAISRWCFRHLTDPVGTFMQVYKLLSPKMNYFLLDGFFYLYEGEKLKNVEGRARMLQFFLQEMKIKFLKRSWTLHNCLDQFIISKPLENSIPTTMVYSSMKRLSEEKSDRYDINSSTIVYFKPHSEIKPLDNLAPRQADPSILSGDFSMFLKLLIEKTFPPTVNWKSLFLEEPPRPLPSISTSDIPIGDKRIGDDIHKIDPRDIVEKRIRIK